MSIESITVRELYQKVEQGEPILLIDVRTPIEFREVHATVARNCPLDSISPETLWGSESPDPERPVYVMCRSGNRSRLACQKLDKLGLQVIDVEGGTDSWVDADLPVVRGKKTVSLERQVRICAGSIVVIGSVLTVALGSFWFLGIPLFVGCGLVFSGITDSCAMGMLLAKMPWNQIPKNKSDVADRSTDCTDKPSGSPNCVS